METVIRHYVRIDLKGGGEFEVWLVEETFDLGKYMKAQFKWALEDPTNRNGVRERYGWNDQTLDANPEVAVKHFLERRGGDWFRENLRPKFIRIKQRPISGVGPECFFMDINKLCKKCSLCKISQRGILNDSDEALVFIDGSLHHDQAEANAQENKSI